MRGNEGGNSVAERNLMIPKKRSIMSPPSLCHNFRYFSSKFGGSLSESSDERSIDSKRAERSNKYTGAKGNLVFLTFVVCIQRKDNSFTNRQYCWSLVYSQKWGYARQDFIRRKQRYLGLQSRKKYF